MGNDYNKHARDEIIDRLHALIMRRRKNREDRERLGMEDRQIDRELFDCKATARFFGIKDIEFPPDAREEYMRLRAIENRIVHHAGVHRVLDGQTALPLPPDKSASTIQDVIPRKMPRIKDIVLDRLKAAGEEGTKAAAVKRYIEQTYSTTIHEKTVGMTLYRLSKSKEKPVRRDGQTWFFVPPKADAKNPGASTPGHINRGN